MEPAERDLLTSIYAAFNARDIQTVINAMDPDVDWPNAWEGGRVHGHAGVRDYWTRQWAAIDPLVTPVGFETDGTGRIIVNVDVVIRDRAGELLGDRTVRHAYTLKDGRIARMDVLEDTED